MHDAIVHDLAVRLSKAVILLKGSSEDALCGIEQVDQIARLMLKATE